MEVFEQALELYSFEELLEMSDITLVEVLRVLVEDGLVKLPEVLQWENIPLVEQTDDYES